MWLKYIVISSQIIGLTLKLKTAELPEQPHDIFILHIDKYLLIQKECSTLQC